MLDAEWSGAGTGPVLVTGSLVFRGSIGLTLTFRFPFPGMCDRASAVVVFVRWDCECVEVCGTASRWCVYVCGVGCVQACVPRLLLCRSICGPGCKAVVQQVREVYFPGLLGCAEAEAAAVGQ